MSLIVMKFGGSSVGDAERMKRVAGRVVEAHKNGHRCVVVVSAMGDTTDDMIDLSRQLNPNPPAREMDMLLANGEQISIALLSMAIHQLGASAVSYTGWQAGITTEAVHGKARISDIEPARINQALDNGNIVIVAGFQGVTADGEITTLGRGGSDTTAVALAAAVKADLCEIYTDVDGIYSTDPRVVKNARKLKEISYDEMLELASLGAKVMQSRSVEFAKKFGVIFEVRSSLNDNPGTIVKEETRSMEDVVIRGVSLDKNQAKVTLVAVPDKPGVAARIFKTLADATINVDMIVQNVSHGAGSPSTDLSFTVDKPELLKATKVLESCHGDLGYRELIADENIGKLSIVGVGMRSSSGVAAKMFDTLATLGVNIDMISTSEIKISVVIDLRKGEDAMRAVHAAFLE